MIAPIGPDEILALVCSCGTNDHLVLVSLLRYETDTELSFSVHLSSKDNILKRMWTAIKHILGHKSRYGDFDEILINKQNAIKLKSMLHNYITALEAMDKRWD